MKIDSIAARLIVARTRRQLTQEEVAKRAGVTQGTISNIEADIRRNPSQVLSLVVPVDSRTTVLNRLRIFERRLNDGPTKTFHFSGDCWCCHCALNTQQNSHACDELMHWDLLGHKFATREHHICVDMTQSRL